MWPQSTLDPLERGLAFVIGLVLVCNLAVVTVHLLDDNTDLIRRDTVTTSPPPTQVRIVPGPGQAFVTGEIDQLAADDAQSEPLALPLTITAVQRGTGRVNIEQALVGARRVTISWDGGTPLPLSGSGGIDLGATHVEVTGGTTAWSLDGRPRKLLPGTYRAGASVAVGTAGLASPRDGVEFTADDQTVLDARGQVVVRVDTVRTELRGPGKLNAKGRMNLQFPDRTEPAANVNFGGGPFRVTLEPRDGKLTIDALLQGPVEVS